MDVTDGPAEGHFKRSRSRCLVYLCLLPFVLFGGLYACSQLFLYSLTRYEAGENAANVDWLPASATRVCWYRTGLVEVFEFDMPEGDFLAWARSPEASQRSPLGALARIEGSPERPISRYTFYLTTEKRKGSGLPPEPPEGLKIVTPDRWPGKELAETLEGADETTRAPWAVQTSMAALRGWRYERHQANGGGLHIEYDADAGRVYYWYAHN